MYFPEGNSLNGNMCQKNSTGNMFYSFVPFADMLLLCVFDKPPPHSEGFTFFWPPVSRNYDRFIAADCRWFMEGIFIANISGTHLGIPFLKIFSNLFGIPSGSQGNKWEFNCVLSRRNVLTKSSVCIHKIRMTVSSVWVVKVFGNANNFPLLTETEQRSASQLVSRTLVFVSWWWPTCLDWCTATAIKRHS